MREADAYLRAMARLPADILWAEADLKRVESLIVTLSDGEVESASAESGDAAYVRACREGAGMAYTQDLRADAGEMIRRAADAGAGFARAADAEAGENVRRAMDELPPPADATALREAGRRVSAAVRACDPRIVSVACEVREDTHRARVVSSRGIDAGRAFRVYTAEVTVSAASGAVTCNASSLVTAESPDALDGAACAREIADALAPQFLPHEDIAPDDRPAVLDSAVTRNILITAWQLFSAEKVQTGASALAGRLGERVAGDALSMTDRPQRTGCGYRYALDDEAAAMGDHTIVSRGVLTGLLHTRLTARQMGCAPTGNAGRVALLTGSIPTALIAVPRVLCVERGTAARSQLLQTMGDGLLIPYSFDIFHSIRIASGDFSIPCRAVRVSGGEMRAQCGDLTMTGNLRELLLNVREAGDDLRIVPFLLRSYCYGAPSLRVESLRVG